MRNDLVIAGKLSRKVEEKMDRTHVALERELAALCEAIAKAEQQPTEPHRPIFSDPESKPLRAPVHIRAGSEQRWTFKAGRQIPRQRDNAGRRVDLRLVECNHRWIGTGATAKIGHDILLDGVMVADSDGDNWRWIDRDAERVFTSVANAGKMIGITEIIPHDFPRFPPSEPTTPEDIMKMVLGGILLLALLVFGAWAGKAHAEENAPAEVYYENCAAARAAGAAPIHQGEPGYRRKLDRDGDGIACE